MFNFFYANRFQSLLITYRRSIADVSQFRRPKDDCCPKPPKRKVIDPKECKVRDKGLVLGVYNNEDAPGEAAMLTESAKKYNSQSGDRLWELLKLSRLPRLGESRIFYDVDKYYAYVAVVGLGTECTIDKCLENREERKEAVRIASSVGAKALQDLGPGTIDVESFGDAESAAEGSHLGVWQFQTFKTLTQHSLVTPFIKLYDSCDSDGWEMGKTKAESQNLVRYLQEMPANILNPTIFATTAVNLLCEEDINVSIMTKSWAKIHKLGGLEKIGTSSVQPPLFVDISYYGAEDHCSQPIVFIGKGVTFDSGSVDLKSCADLQYMRGDMAGAACVIAVLRAASLLKMKVNLRGIMPLCELMPNGRSPKYLDIVQSGNKNILLRTPAREGRILLADCLTQAKALNPKYIIDIGTMCKDLLYTLGGSASGCYSNSQELQCLMKAASSLTGDRVWEMPLWNYYENRITDTKEADIANAGLDEYADSPNCAAFLKQFVTSPWLHLDTYNVAYTKGYEIPYLRKGMSGRPVRTLIEFLFQYILETSKAVK